MSTLTFVVVSGGGIIVMWLVWELYCVRKGKKVITDVVREWGTAGAALISLVMGLLIGRFYL